MSERVVMENWRVGYRDKSSSYRQNRIYDEVKTSLHNMDTQIIRLNNRVRDLSLAATLNDTLKDAIVNEISGVYSTMLSNVNSGSGDKIYLWSPMDGIDAGSTNVTVRNDYGFVGLSYKNDGDLVSSIPTYTDDYGTTWPADNVSIMVDNRELRVDSHKRLIANTLTDSVAVWEVDDATPVTISVNVGRSSTVPISYIKFIPCPMYTQRIKSIGYIIGGTKVAVASDFTPNGQVFLPVTGRPQTDGIVYVELVPVSSDGHYYVGSELFDFGTVSYADGGTSEITVNLDSPTSQYEITSMLVYDGDTAVTSNIADRAVFRIIDGENIVYDSSSSTYRWPFVRNYTGNVIEVNDGFKIQTRFHNKSNATFRLSQIVLTYRIME